METKELNKRILDCLTFAEPFKTLEEEVSVEVNQLADALKVLIVKDLVQPMRHNSSKDRWEKSMFYDSDNMHDFRYQITSKGLDILF